MWRSAEQSPHCTDDQAQKISKALPPEVPFLLVVSPYTPALMAGGMTLAALYLACQLASPSFLVGIA